MSTVWTRIRRMLGAAIPTSIAMMAMGGGAAWAQETCPSTALDPRVLPMVGFPGYMDPNDATACANLYGGGNIGKGCFRFDGSDTLTDVVQKSIKATHACLSYHNIGSGQAETNILAGAGTGSGTVNQGIGPMSRNFKVTVANNDTSLGTVIHPTWVPSDPNVVGLDAAIWTFLQKNGQCIDLRNSTWPPSPPASCNAAIAAGVSPLAVIISGNPTTPPKSLATTAECANPCRVWLVEYLSSNSCAGTPIEHILRRDDKSGTQDTIREKLNVDRWCNGKSEGNVNAPGSNLFNEDLDPIRRDCMAGAPNYAVSRCTYYPTSQNCQFGDGAIPANGSLVIRGTTVTNSYNEPLKCTQGLLVALSENDPNVDDITKSIGFRVAFGAGVGTGSIIGIAGLASNVAGATHTNIDGITTLPSNIFQGNYLFARRLFIMRNPDFVQANALDAVPGRPTEEQKLFNWMTNPTTGDICTESTLAGNAGFLPKWQDGTTCAGTSTTPPTNLGDCSTGGNGRTLTCLKADPGVGTPKQNIGDETSNNACDANYPCVANGVHTASSCGGVGGLCPLIPVLSTTGSACNLNAKCSGGVCSVDGCCGSCP